MNEWSQHRLSWAENISLSGIDFWRAIVFAWLISIEVTPYGLKMIALQFELTTKIFTSTSHFSVHLFISPVLQSFLHSDSSRTSCHNDSSHQFVFSCFIYLSHFKAVKWCWILGLFIENSSSHLIWEQNLCIHQKVADSWCQSSDSCWNTELTYAV